MIIHRLILNSDLRAPSSELEEVLKLSYPEASHPARIQGFYSSRNALLECLRGFQPKASFKDLHLKDYKELESFPDYVLSLSHSPLAGAAVLAPKSEFDSVGIDIEIRDRLVKESILARVTTNEDFTLPGIQTWCLKEAIYKCVSNSKKFNGVLEFRELRILDGKWTHSPSGLSGEWIQFEEKDHQVAIATLKNQNS